MSNKIQTAGYYVDTDVSDKTISKKIRDAQLMQYNYILVLGEEEMNNNTVNTRTRDNTQHGQQSVEQLLTIFAKQLEEYK